MIEPDFALEQALLQHHEAIVGIDEVGRGALAGPVCVGAAIVTRATTPTIPDGLRDSKLVPAAARAGVAQRVRHWVAAGAVGSASAAEIDEIGIIAALRLAASRALGEVTAVLAPQPTAVILDGSHNWLEATLLDAHLPHLEFAQVVVRPKADAHCGVVAAASVLAKVFRDDHMAEIADAGYGFAVHKGYGVPHHLAALASLGPSEFHRRTWRLPEPSRTSGVVAGHAGGMMDA